MASEIWGRLRATPRQYDTISLDRSVFQRQWPAVAGGQWFGLPLAVRLTSSIGLLPSKAIGFGSRFIASLALRPTNRALPLLVWPNWTSRAVWLPASSSDCRGTTGWAIPSYPRPDCRQAAERSPTFRIAP